MLPFIEVASRLRRHPYCFAIRRMRFVWRRADEHYDETGRAADLTIASSRARRDWSDLIWLVMNGNYLVRVRHQHRDEPAIILTESRFRELERLARRASEAEG